jgi:hypothetical protein
MNRLAMERTIAARRCRSIAPVGSELTLLVALTSLFFAAASFAAEPRYAVVWLDGSRTTGEEVEDWGRVDAAPRVGNRALFDAKNPARWLMDVSLPGARQSPGMGESFVEFIGGDRLPGRVVAYADDVDGASWPLGRRLIVETPLNLDLPGFAGRTRIPVALDRVRRIVAVEHSGRPLEPGTLRHADGRRLKFRALHWRNDGVQILSEAGSVSVALSEVHELCLPQLDPWKAFYAELAVLSPQLSGRLIRLETTGGLRLTTSLARLECRSIGGAGPDKWLHIVQPIWSLEPLGVRHREVRERIFFAPDEAPLSRFQPVASRHQAALSAAWDVAQPDRNVQGGPLVCGGQRYAWGLGVHAHHELDYLLPPTVRRMRASVGLDQLAGSGGAAIARLLLDGQLQWASPLLVGSKQVVRLGPIEFKQPRGQSRLTLIADAAEKDKPAGADPWDIRDLVDWLEPALEFDRASLGDEVSAAAASVVPGLAGWEVDPPADGGAWRAVSLADNADRQSLQFRMLLEISTPLTLRRRVAIPAKRRALLVGLARRGAEQNRTSFEISLDGRRLGARPLPALGAQGELRAIEVELADPTAQEVELTVRIDPQGHKTVIDWRGLRWPSLEEMSGER